MKNEKVYYISQYDGLVHNINDVDHEIIYSDNKVTGAYIGYMTTVGFRVDEKVNLYSIEEVAIIFNTMLEKIKKNAGEREVFTVRELMSELDGYHSVILACIDFLVENGTFVYKLTDGNKEDYILSPKEIKHVF